MAAHSDELTAAEAAEELARLDADLTYATERSAERLAQIKQLQEVEASESHRISRLKEQRPYLAHIKRGLCRERRTAHDYRNLCDKPAKDGSFYCGIHTRSRAARLLPTGPKGNV